MCKSYQGVGLASKILRNSVIVISIGSHTPTSRTPMNRSLSPERFKLVDGVRDGGELVMGQLIVRSQRGLRHGEWPSAESLMGR